MQVCGRARALYVSRLAGGRRGVRFGAFLEGALLPWILLPLVLLTHHAVSATPLDPSDPAAWVIPSPDLYALAVEGERVCAVGYWGTILLSEDGGDSFRPVRTSVREALFAVDFFDARSGWAVGARGTILATRDGGQSWQPQTAWILDAFGDRIELDVSLFGVQAVSPLEAWAVGDAGVVLRTRDGETWEQIPLSQELLGDDNLIDRILNGVHFADPTHGFIVGEFGTVLYSADGGESWSRQPHVSSAGDDPYIFDVAASVSQQDVRQGANVSAAAVGLAGSVWVWDRGETRWQTRSIAGGASLYAVAQRGDHLVAVGDRGAVHWSADAGRTWQRAGTPRILGWLRAVEFATDARVFSVGAGGVLLRSNDAGRSFDRVNWDPRATR